MGKYTLKDFKIGEAVYHLSNKKLIMVVIQINMEMNEVTCRWIDERGQIQIIEFMPEELGKSSDLGPRITKVSL